MSIEIEGNAVRCTVDASEPSRDGRSYEVTFRATAANVEQIRSSEFASKVNVAEELRALRSMVMEMADLILEQRATIDRLEEELDEGTL